MILIIESAPSSIRSTANFYYDADGKQVKSIVGGVTTYYVGQHYEKKGTTVTKYYFAGTTRIAARSGTNGTLSFLLSDHLGSSSVTTDANGGFTASALYKAFGETRYTTGNLGTDYKFTGQREEATLGIYFFNARWYDGSLGRFTSPDTIVPTGTQGTQAWDRYAFVNNNPVRYTDPTGHRNCEEDGYNCPGDTDEDILEAQFESFEKRKTFSKGDYENEYGIDLNPDEYKLFLNDDGTLDRVKLLIYFALSRKAINQANALFPDDSSHNGPRNAFQHAYWSALLVNQFGSGFAESITNAHEGNHDAIKQTQFMDSYNNRVGIGIAEANSPNIPHSTLAVLVYLAVQNGATVYLEGNGPKNFSAHFTGATPP